MSIVVDEIAEAHATGLVADIYADIRVSLDLPLVNLIWRHLATQPPALEWAWHVAKPLYTSGAAAHESAAFANEVDYSVIGRLPVSVMEAIGLSVEDRVLIRKIIDAYNLGNGLNLIALSAVLIEPAGASVSPEAKRAGDAGEATRAVSDPLPPVPPLSTLAPHLARLVTKVNRFGSRGEPAPVVASLYRHLAIWPSALALVWSALAPLERTGQLDALVSATQLEASTRAARVASLRGNAASRPESTFARAAIEAFVNTAICRMVPIGWLLNELFRTAEET